MLRFLRAGPVVPALAVAVMGLGSPPLSPGVDAYRDEILAWRAKRVESLRAPGGWLSLVGLSWLEPGKNAVGSGSGNRVLLPPGKAPAFVGSIDRDGAAATFHAAPGAGVTIDGNPVTTQALRSDADGDPTRLTLGSLSFYVIRRGERLGVRVKDSQSEARSEFHGIESFPIDSRWRLEARLEPYDPPKSITVPTVLGTADTGECPGALVFQIDGTSYRLDAVLEQGETDLFVIFADRTNGADTYGAGRFLYVSPATDGRTTIDFNKAYNPPCAFSPYATCPLPPPQNRLPIRIDAGEKAYGKH